MSYDCYMDRIKELRLQCKGPTEIARILMQEHPEDVVSSKTWKTRVDRCLVKLGLNRSCDIPKHSNSTNTIQNNKSVECKSDGSYVYNAIIELFENEEVTPERLMQAHGLDPNIWEVCSYKNNYWSQQTKNGQTVILYQSKVIVKPRKAENIAMDLVLSKFIEQSHRHEYPKPLSIQNKPNPILHEINICDLHLGKLAFDSISGDVYNAQIAKEKFFKLINTEYRRAKENKVEKILFVWSNDFFNTDGISNATTKGTPQQTALSWQSLFLEGCSMLVDAIELLSTVAPVKSFYIASNHSRQSDFYALCYLQAWFRNNENVDIVINQKSRYYEKYGVVLLGFSHSSYEKESQLYHLMSSECAEDWSDTQYREFHLAHYHSERVKEIGGVIYRWLPTVCGTDSWHHEKGYVGGVKRSYSFLYDKCVGLIQMNCVII